MLVAEQGRQPLGLAGIPYEDSYAQFAVANADELKPASDEVDGAGTDVTQPATDQDGVTLVLNDMFSLFNQDGSKKKAKKAAAPRRQEALVLPQANTDRRRKKSFFDSIFGSSDEKKKKKKRKRKPLFSF